MAELTNKIVKTQDPRMSLQRGSKMVIEEGARIVSLYNRPAATASSSGVTFDNIDPGSTGFVVDRKFYIKGQFTCNLVLRRGGNLPSAQNAVDATAQTNFALAVDRAVGASALGISYGPRAFPLARATRNIELVINGETFTYQLNEYIDPLMRYDNLYHRDKIDYSMTPAMQDYYPTYEALLSNDPNVQQDLGLNPFQDYGYNINKEGRGSYFGDVCSVVQPDGTILPAFQAGLAGLTTGQAKDIKIEDCIYNVLKTEPGGEFLYTLQQVTVNLVITEPVMVPILKFGEPDCRGFIGVNDLRLALTFDSNLQAKVLSGITSRTLEEGGVDVVYSITSSVTPASEDNWRLFYNILTPKLIPELPDSNMYPDERIKIDGRTNANAFTKGGLIQHNSPNLSISTVPKRIYIVACYDQQKLIENNPDIYFSLDALTFQFNNQNTQFSGASSEQLYLMSKRNGLQLSFPQWKSQVGSVMCIDFARDVSLDTGDYPGRIGNYNFNYQATFRALRDYPVNSVKIYTIIVEEGYSVIQNQVCSRTGGLIQVDPTSIPDELRPAIMSYGDANAHLYGAGSFMKDLKKFGRQAAHGIGKAVDIAKEYGPKVAHGIEKAAPYIEKGLAIAAPLLAAGGMSEMEARGILQKYGYDDGMKKIMNKAMKGKKGGGLVGGAKASKKGMKKQLTLY